MADQYRYRHGQQEIATYGVALATVIERSDMLWIDTTNNEVKNAASFTFNNDLATTQAEFVDLFVGIAKESSTSAQSANLAVDISADSVYEFGVTSATYNVGDPLGASDNVSALTLLDDQSLEAAIVTSANAKAFDFAESAVTLLKVKFASVHNVSANVSALTIG